MTLCIAWKQKENEYSFISDSRLMKDKNFILTNHATKIFKIDVCVEQFGGTSFKASYGVCFSGSYLHASLIIEALQHFMSHLQYNNKELSFEKIITKATSFIENMLHQLHQDYPYNDGLKMLIGGWCPYEKKFKFNKIELVLTTDNETGENNAKCKKKDVDLECQSAFVGSENAKKKVLNFFNNDRYTYPEALKKVIDEKQDNTVGGPIQIGYFTNQNFEITGTAIPEKIIDNGFYTVKDIYYFRGVKFNLEDLYDDDFVLTQNFGLPFDNLRDKLFKEANDENNQIIMES